MRDKIKDIAYFNEYIEKHTKLLKKLKEGIANSGENTARKNRFLMASVDEEFELLKATYSVGQSLDEVKKYFDDLLIEIPLFWGEKSNVTYMYDLLALAILFNTDKEKILGLIELTKKNNRYDGLINLYSKYICTGSIDVKGNSAYGEPYDTILQIVSNNENSEIQLKDYLEKKWYKGNKQQSWYNTHNNKLNVYTGYWSFEAGAISKILNLEDSALKDVPYYPYDLVHFNN